MSNQPTDELAARRRAKATPDLRQSALLAGLEAADFDLIDSMHRLVDGHLLVNADEVLEICERVDRIILGLLLAERERLGLG